MKKNFFLFLMLFLIGDSLSAQKGASIVGISSYVQGVFNLPKIRDTYWELSYERGLTERISIRNGLSLHYNKYNVEESSYSDKTRIVEIVINPEIRYYILNLQQNRFYVGAGPTFLYNHSKSKITPKANNQTEIVKNGSFHGGVFTNVGYQYIIASRWVTQVNIGIGTLLEKPRFSFYNVGLMLGYKF